MKSESYVCNDIENDSLLVHDFSYRLFDWDVNPLIHYLIVYSMDVIPCDTFLWLKA